MPYADFQLTDQYTSRVPGASVEVLIINSRDPADVIIGKVTGANANEDFETLPVEEAGESGVEEIAQGRHTGSMTVPAFYSPKWNDSLPTRQTFLGREYTIIKRIAADFPNAGTVLEVYTGCRLNRIGTQQAARGLMTFDLSFLYKRRYNGAEWAAFGS